MSLFAVFFIRRDGIQHYLVAAQFIILSVPPLLLRRSYGFMLNVCGLFS
jgi:hypothetical protein